MPLSLSALSAYFFKSLGANHKRFIQLLKLAEAFWMSIPKGSTYWGLCSVEVVPLFTTNVAAQNGHLSELILGSSVDVAPQLSHFTVATSIFSSLLKLRARKSSRPISSI